MNATPANHRYWIPITTTTLFAAAFVWLGLKDDLDNNIWHWVLWFFPVLALIFVALWFVLFSRFPGALRLKALGALVLLFAVFKGVTRVDGAVSGTGLPNYVWRWSPEPQRTFAKEVQANAPTLADAPDVPEFRGTGRTGILVNPGLETDWKAHPPRELWRISVGEGWGAFCVVGGRAITQEQRGEEEWVTCYDLGTGKVLWHHADKARFTEWQGGDGPRANPTHDAGRLYTIGGTGILNCLEVATGKLLWTRNTLKEHNQKNLQWAIAGSPLIVDGNVIVTGGDKPGPTLVAYDKMTGEPKWKVGDMSATYASPLLATIAGKRVIVDNVATGLLLHDAATGAILLNQKWGFEGPPKCSQPVVLSGDRIFISAGYMMGCTVFQIKADGDKLSATEVWSNSKMKTQFNSVTPMGDTLIGLDDGPLACIEAATGKRLWKEGKFGNGQHLLVGDLALIQSEPGPVTLAQVSREGFKQLATLNALSAKTWNYPTLAGRYLIVRNDREAACYELPVKKP